MVWKKIEQPKKEYWDINKEESIEGIYNGIIDVEISGKPARQGMITTKDRENVALPSHAILLNRLSEIETGARIKIVHTGIIRLKDGTKAKNYDVFVDV